MPFVHRIGKWYQSMSKLWSEFYQWTHTENNNRVPLHFTDALEERRFHKSRLQDRILTYVGLRVLSEEKNFCNKWNLTFFSFLRFFAVILSCMMRITNWSKHIFSYADACSVEFSWQQAGNRVEWKRSRVVVGVMGKIFTYFCTRRLSDFDRTQNQHAKL